MFIEADQCKNGNPKRHNKEEGDKIVVGVDVVQKWAWVVLNAGDVGKREGGKKNDGINDHKDETVKFGISAGHNAIIVPFYGGYGVH